MNKPQKHTKSLWCHQTLGNPPAMELRSEDQLDPLAGKMQNPVNLIPMDPDTSEKMVLKVLKHTPNTSQEGTWNRRQ